MKITQKSLFETENDKRERLNFDKIILTPPFLPNPDFGHESKNNLGSAPSTNSNLYDNFRFKSKLKI